MNTPASSFAERSEVDHAAVASVKAAMRQGHREIILRRTRSGAYQVLVVAPWPALSNSTNEAVLDSAEQNSPGDSG